MFNTYLYKYDFVITIIFEDTRIENGSFIAIYHQDLRLWRVDPDQSAGDTSK